MSEINRKSEYSNGSLESQNDKIQISEEETKAAKGKIYSLLLSSPRAKIALLPSLLLGVPNIVTFVICGRVLNNLVSGLMDPSYDALHEVFLNSMYMLAVAVASGILKYIDSYCWMQCGSELSIKIRKNLFNKMMRSEVTFFDVNPIGGILTLLSEDAQKVQDSFGPIKGTQLQNLGMFLGGIIATFIYSWKIGLVMVGMFVAIMLIVMAFMFSIDKPMKLKFKYLAEEMTIAEETISSIRTVRSFNRENTEVHRFKESNRKSQLYEKKASIIITVMITLIMVVIWGVLLGNLYWAAVMVDKGENGFGIGDIFAIFGFCMNGSFAILGISASGDSETKAIQSGARIIKLSEYEPKIQFEGGDKIKEFKGHIEFKNVSFKYPTRDAYVLKNVSFVISPGQMGALVGHSGSGKSTCIQLLERFYDATEGEILLDGVDIKTLDPRWLHEKIALVAQEPVLFKMSIKDNILYGARNATNEQVLEAAEIANVKKFVEKLEKEFDTMVGEKGSLLSGGQKQRIAIARAVIRDPVILMTDEATSALDAGSEKKVQLALNKVMENRTSVVVAHRLSTVKNAHIIYVFDAGEIKESGTHQELVALKGHYYNLVHRQLNDKEEKELSFDSNQNVADTSSTPNKVESVVDDSNDSSDSIEEISSSSSSSTSSSSSSESDKSNSSNKSEST
ncbi:ABC transporter B family member 4 [Tritrichomonas foetus]|uniref:ABC transporter B family member 4 n=1 Tax=Tritrichomonas foetus TaxID=1144522 RepID=A0A1J4JQL6_9EUKA|nr:ABC transporter B family member 4 [Tritrichomonas foetus]|eukprot:OHT01409.1 ABC transporter B family member 4 [Tritrichomonas foetus]